MLYLSADVRCHNLTSSKLGQLGLEYINTVSPVSAPNIAVRLCSVRERQEAIRLMQLLALASIQDNSPPPHPTPRFDCVSQALIAPIRLRQKSSQTVPGSSRGNNWVIPSPNQEVGTLTRVTWVTRTGYHPAALSSVVSHGLWSSVYTDRVEKALARATNRHNSS